MSIGFMAEFHWSEPFGSGRGSTSGSGCCGCCGSCCSKSFDEDAFEEQVRKDLEKTRDPNAPVPVQQQMTPSSGMQANFGP